MIALAVRRRRRAPARGCRPNLIPAQEVLRFVQGTAMAIPDLRARLAPARHGPNPPYRAQGRAPGVTRGSGWPQKLAAGDRKRPARRIGAPYQQLTSFPAAPVRAPGAAPRGARTRCLPKLPANSVDPGRGRARLGRTSGCPRPAAANTGGPVTLSRPAGATSAAAARRQEGNRTTARSEMRSAGRWTTLHSRGSRTEGYPTILSAGPGARFPAGSHASDGVGGAARSCRARPGQTGLV